jgi:fibronectin type 3 domain-containing protein
MIQAFKIAFVALVTIGFGLTLKPPFLCLPAFGQESPRPYSPENPDAQPKAHSVNLNWKASTSAVVGYNVYRADKSEGQFTKLNASPISKTNYKDTGVQAGHTYFYKVAAVDRKGTESPSTGPIRATVPSP